MAQSASLWKELGKAFPSNDLNKNFELRISRLTYMPQFTAYVSVVIFGLFFKQKLFMLHWVHLRNKSVTVICYLYFNTDIQTGIHTIYCVYKNAIYLKMIGWSILILLENTELYNKILSWQRLFNNLNNRPIYYTLYIYEIYLK